MAKVLIADDNERIRAAVKSLISIQPGLTVCGEAQDGIEAIAKAKQLDPDLVLLDFQMPLMNGLEAASQLKKEFPNVPILLITLYKD